MRRTVILLAIASAIGTMLILSSAKAAQSPIAACDCNTPLQTTAMVWGEGATCTAAFLDALNQARALTNCEDGVCFENVVIDNECWLHANGDYMVDLHLEFRCYDCGSIHDDVAAVAEPVSSH